MRVLAQSDLHIDMNHVNQDSHCRCKHHVVGPILIILIGLSFLLGHLGVIDELTYSVSWPVFIILLGLTKLGGGACKCYMR